MSTLAMNLTTLDKHTPDAPAVRCANNGVNHTIFPRRHRAEELFTDC